MSLKNIFFKDDETGDPKSPVKSEVGKTVNPVISTPVTPTFSGIQGMVNEKILSGLKDVIKKNNITGIDYYEFSQNVEQLNNIIPDDKTKFAAAYASLITSGGVTKAVLLSSIDTYLVVIAKEKENFAIDLKKRYDDIVGKRTQGITDAQKRIGDLQKELTSLSQFVIEETQNVQQEELKLKQVESNFEASIAHLIACLNSDKEKINLYIA
jgi:hypothetical protein